MAGPQENGGVLECQDANLPRGLLNVAAFAAGLLDESSRALAHAKNVRMIAPVAVGMFLVTSAESVEEGSTAGVITLAVVAVTGTASQKRASRVRRSAR